MAAQRNPFEVLGVSESATTAEVNAAHRRLAREFHPDQHPGATPDEKKRLTDAMAMINDAWSVLKDESARAAYLRDLTAEPTPWQPVPLVDECDLCGSFPVRRFSFEHQTAWLIPYTRYGMQMDFCRDCALSYGRAKQNRTLWTGWWGLWAFFSNLMVLFRNAGNLHNANKLPAPQRRPNAFHIMAAPMAPGRPSWQRSGIIVFLGVIVAIGAAFASSIHQNDPAYTPPCLRLGGRCLCPHDSDHASSSGGLRRRARRDGDWAGTCRPLTMPRWNNQLRRGRPRLVLVHSERITLDATGTDL